MGKLKRLLVQNFKKLSVDYLENSTIHGVCYLIKEKSKIGKFVWCITLKCCILSCLVVISYLLGKYQESPLITDVNVDNIENTLLFPSLFICPHDAINYEQRRVIELKRNVILWNCLTRFGQFERDKKFPIDCFNVSTTGQIPFKEILTKIFYTCGEYFIYCAFKGTPMDCCMNFFPVFTEVGFCFVFNNGFIEDTNRRVLNPQLRHIYETDEIWDLEILTRYHNTTNKIFAEDTFATLDFKVVPKVVIDQSSRIISLRITETYATEEMKQLYPSQRKCLFSSERIFMKDSEADYYEYTRCLSDSRQLFFQENCGCTPFFYIPINQLRECTIIEYKCIYDKTRYIHWEKYNCPFNCRTFDYEIWTSEELENNFDNNSVRLIVTVIGWPMFRYRNNVLFGWIELLSSLGGIAGFFLGCSLLSGIEILYYITMRFMCAIKLNREELEKMAKDDKSEKIEPVNMSLSLSRKSNKIFSKALH